MIPAAKLPALAALLAVLMLLLAGCQEPDNAAELRAAHDFCAGQHSSVKSVQFLQYEGNSYRVVCRNGAVAE